jgi:dephospho-CoA kinase
MLVIGLTGGLGTGKSEVSRLLREMGATIIDADQVGHEAYLKDTESWQEVIAAFGQEVLHPSGEIDRKKLGDRVFGDPQALANLNSIIHPKMHHMMGERLRQLSDQWVEVAVVEAAILIEANWLILVDELWVTIAPKNVVLERVRNREDWPEKAILSRIGSQLPETERVRHAQVIVDNSGSLETLTHTIKELWETRIKKRLMKNAP